MKINLIGRWCFFFALVILRVKSVSAQNSECGFEYMIQQQSMYDSAVTYRIEDINRSLERSAYSSYPIISTRNKKSIPIVVHIVWSSRDENMSDEQVFSQIEILNQSFNSQNTDIDKVPEEFRSLISKEGIQFCLAAQNPKGENNTGIIRVKTEVTQIGLKEALYYSALGGSDAWDTDKYLNIWIADTGEFLTGFGTYPNQAEARKQGVVINSKYFGKNESNNFNIGRVTVHEIGHYLGLNHIWGADNNCEEDDGVLDTPFQRNAYQGCPDYPQVSCANSDLFMNFMDYVNDECMLMFTQGQMDRMMNTLEIFRPELLNSELPCVTNNGNDFSIDFTIYPNPSEGIIAIGFSAIVTELVNVKIYNVIGQIVYEDNRVVRNEMTIDTKIKSKGIYFFKIGNIVKKMIVH